MTLGQVSAGRDRVWARRKRDVIPANKLRARSLRRSPTDAERKLWWHLRYDLDLKGSHFRRQVHVGPYIVDFLSHRLKLIIEVDGGQHASRSVLDAKRTAFLRGRGYRVLRFWNNDVFTNVEGVLAVIQGAVLATPTILATPTPPPPRKGEGR